VTGDQARPLLRALRREPALVDDRAAADRLAPTGLTPEAVRWARAWLVCWQAALAADPRAGLDEPWEIAVRLADVVAAVD